MDNDFCDNCQFLSITENDQQKINNKLPHRCTLFNVDLLHGDMHPKLLKLDLCKKLNLNNFVISEINRISENEYKMSIIKKIKYLFQKGKR